MERQTVILKAGRVLAVMLGMILSPFAAAFAQGPSSGHGPAGSPPASDATIFGHNLIANGGAETGAGTDGLTTPAAIPGWTVSGGPRVITYASGYDLLASGIVPNNHLTNYFAGGLNTAASSLTQAIDLSSGAASIDTGTVTYDVSGYLGGRGDNTAVLTVTFLGGSANQLGVVTLGPVTATDKELDSALYFRRQIGPVPIGARTANVVVQFNPASGGANDGYADVLELALNIPGAPGTLMETNLISNAGAEAATAGTAIRTAADVPNWVRTANFSTDSYDDPDGDLAGSNLTSPKAGSNYFWGGTGSELSSAYQDIDISAAASLIDAGRVSYTLVGWLGGWASQGDNTVVTADFKKWDQTKLSTATIGPVTAADRNNVSGLLQRLTTGQIPAGTRVVRIRMTMSRTDGTANDGLADNLSLLLSSPDVPALPSINSGGVITASDFGGFPTIAPATFVEIYGTNLAGTTGGWTAADFLAGHTAPTSLNGVSVTVGGKPAFISYTSPGQVNAQVPDVATGPQPVVLTNSVGSSQSYTATVNATQPGLLAPPLFLIGGKQYVVAYFANGSLVLPPGTLPGLVTRQAHPGETIVMYGLGFGPVTPVTPAGEIATGLTQLNGTLRVQIGGATADVNYAGMAPTYVGLYQFNVVVPDIASNDFAPLVFTLNDVPISQQLYVAVAQ